MVIWQPLLPISQVLINGVSLRRKKAISRRAERNYRIKVKNAFFLSGAMVICWGEKRHDNLLQTISSRGRPSVIVVDESFSLRRAGCAHKKIRIIIQARSRTIRDTLGAGRAFPFSESIIMDFCRSRTPAKHTFQINNAFAACPAQH